MYIHFSFSRRRPEKNMSSLQVTQLVADVKTRAEECAPDTKQQSTLDGVFWDVHPSTVPSFAFAQCLKTPAGEVAAYFPAEGSSVEILIHIRLNNRPRVVFRITTTKLDHVSATSTHFVLWGFTSDGKTDVFVFDMTSPTLPFCKVGNDMVCFNSLCIGHACTLAPRLGVDAVATVTYYGSATSQNKMNREGFRDFPTEDGYL